MIGANRILLLSAGLTACQPFDAPSDRDELDVPVRRAPRIAPEAKLSSGLRLALDTGSDQPLTVLIELAEQVDLKALSEQLTREVPAKAGRREAAVAALQQVAARSQGRLEPLLTELSRRGWVERYRGYTVTNRMLVVGLPRAIRAVARHEEVAAVLEETAERLPALAHSGDSGSVATALRTWAVQAVRAHVAWREGLTGAGVVIGIIDAGASSVHEQLDGQFSEAEDSWYDPEGGQPAPRDAVRGHGTGLLSAALGRNVEGKTVGVAPGATWVACAGLPEGRYHNVALLECADWVLNRAQPDILINAWVLPTAGCDPDLEPIVAAWRAAEMLPVFAAGNGGPGVGTDRSPANYGGLYPGGRPTLSVGGLAAPDSLYPPSSRGPSSCDGSTYPSLVAPAAEVTVAFPLTESTYLETEGTSVAAALVAGAAALLLQRYPEASVWELEEALRAGAIDLGPPGPDNGFGYGRLDVPGALSALARLRGTNESRSNRDEAPRQP